MSALPAEVTIYEVGPRDGLQNESRLIDTSIKIEFITQLLAAGLPAVEATSFVHPQRVPQLADADEVAAAVLSYAAQEATTQRVPVLVPNERGLDRAIAVGAHEIAVFVSATESFAQANLGTSLTGQMSMVTPVISRALAAGLRVRAYVSMCWGDPWEGAVAHSAVQEVASQLLSAGAHEISLGDTIGVATASEVQTLLRSLRSAGCQPHNTAVHFHDTYGQATANVLAALEEEITIIDSSAGGLGGCPFAMSATGNLATEDILWCLHQQGVRTGVDLEAVVAATTWLSQETGLQPQSRAYVALSHRFQGISPGGPA
jgi:hydroxymethylglutaryl-CoA lyase